MTRFLRTSLALGLLAATAIASPALAGPGGGCGGRGGRLKHFESSINELNLPADTNQAVFAALDKARTEQRAIFPDLRTAHGRMRDLLAADNPSADAVTEQADVLSSLKAQMQRSRVQALVTIRSLLTSAQWQQLQESMHQGRRHGTDEPVS
jgi:Spy/CpxP family protein refolding chaperone